MLKVSFQGHKYGKPNKNRNSLLLQRGVEIFYSPPPRRSRHNQWRFIQEAIKTCKDRGNASWTVLKTHVT